jgi:hypothetical protein
MTSSRDRSLSPPVSKRLKTVHSVDNSPALQVSCDHRTHQNFAPGLLEHATIQRLRTSYLANDPFKYAVVEKLCVRTWGTHFDYGRGRDEVTSRQGGSRGRGCWYRNDDQFTLTLLLHLLAFKLRLLFRLAAGLAAGVLSWTFQNRDFLGFCHFWPNRKLNRLFGSGFSLNRT